MSGPGWTLLVLAAGRGSRFGGPKQLEPLGPRGELLSDYALRDAEAVGAARAVFVIAAEHEAAFRAHHEGRDGGLPVDYAHQQLDDLPRGFAVPEGRTKPWGTTHAVLAARHQVDGSFLIVNADDYYGREAMRAAGQFLSVSPSTRPPLFAAIAFPLVETLSPNGPVSRAVLETDDADHLIRIEERHDVVSPSDHWVSMNCWACPAEAMSLLEPCFVEFLEHAGTSLTAESALPETIGVLVRERRARVRVIRAGHGWLGVTHASDRDFVKERLKAVG